MLDLMLAALDGPGGLEAAATELVTLALELALELAELALALELSTEDES